MLTEVEARHPVSQATTSTSGLCLVPGWREATFPPCDLRRRRACWRRRSATCSTRGVPKFELPALNKGRPRGGGASLASARLSRGFSEKLDSTNTASPEPPSWRWNWNTMGRGLRLPGSGYSGPRPRRRMSRRWWRAPGGAAVPGAGCAGSSP